MKKSKLLLASTLLFVVLAYMMSVPVLSSENPWDADGGNGNGGTGSPFDSSLIDAGGGARALQVASAPAVPYGGLEANWITKATIRVTFFVVSHFTQRTPKKVQTQKAAF